MKFYHRTTEKVWKEIQEEGVLWGVHGHPGNKIKIGGYRYTYFSPKECMPSDGYGPVLLEVEYEPRGIGVKDEDGEIYDNYGFDPPPGMICWQFSVFKPIPISNVRRIE